MPSKKRVGLGDKKEGGAIEKALSGNNAQKHAQEDAQAHVQAYAQQPVHVPVPPQGHEPIEERLHCLVTSSQKEYIEELAESWGVSQGAVVRYLIRYYRANSGEE